MFRLSGEQKVFRVGNAAVGGQPGENPTLMVGTMFYSGHGILEKGKERKFDEKKAEELLNRQETFSEQTGLPCATDVVANTPEQMERYVDFVAGHSSGPISMDAWKIPPKVGGAKYAAEVGLADRMIYNSIAPWSEDIEGEIEAVKGTGLKTAILVAYNTEDPTPAGRVTLLKDGGLLEKAERAGFTQPLVDTSVLNVPATAFSCEAARLVKEEFGIPAGCAPSNGTDMWKEARDMWGDAGFQGVDAGLHAIAAALWCDFLLYGPIESASWLFPAVAAADAAKATFANHEADALPGGKHPLNLLFSDFADQLKK